MRIPFLAAPSILLIAPPKMSNSVLPSDVDLRSAAKEATGRPMMTASSSIRRLLTAETTHPSIAADYALAQNVVLVQAWDGSSRLLNLGGHFFGLPAASTEMLVALLERGFEAAVAHIAEQFHAPQARVREDLAVFARDLASRGLIRKIWRPGTEPAGAAPNTGASRGAPGRGRALPRLLSLLNQRLVKLLIGDGTADYRRVWILEALAQFHLWTFGWAGSVALWKAATDDRGRARLDSKAAPHAAEISRSVCKAAARHVLPVDCKVRSLCSWALLRRAAAPAKLVVGVDLFPFVGHCWCECGDAVVGQTSAPSARFVPVIWYE